VVLPIEPIVKSGLLPASFAGPGEAARLIGADFEAPPNAGDAVRLIGADAGKYPKFGSPGLWGGDEPHWLFGRLVPRGGPDVWNV